MNDHILVTGSTGKTGRLIAQQLVARGAEARLAMRRPEAPNHVQFDWDDVTTYGRALKGASSIYLVAPTDRTEQLAVMRPFLEQAVAEVRGRLVLLSASSLSEGGPMMGAVHAWLRQHAPRWIVLRPTWFMQNFTTQHRPSIVQEGRIYSATLDGRVPFIDAADIAAVAAEALTDPTLPSGEHVLTGPEALTYDEVAHLISHAAGRLVRHCRLSASALADRFVSLGVPENYSIMLARMDEAIADGGEDRITEEVQRITGRPPNTLANFISSHLASLKGLDA